MNSIDVCLAELIQRRAQLDEAIECLRALRTKEPMLTSSTRVENVVVKHIVENRTLVKTPEVNQSVQRVQEVNRAPGVTVLEPAKRGPRNHEGSAAQKVQKFVEEKGHVNAGQVSRGLGITMTLAGQTLCRLKSEGKIVRVSPGQYASSAAAHPQKKTERVTEEPEKRDGSDIDLEPEDSSANHSIPRKPDYSKPDIQQEAVLTFAAEQGAVWWTVLQLEAWLKEKHPEVLATENRRWSLRPNLITMATYCKLETRGQGAGRWYRQPPPWGKSAAATKAEAPADPDLALP